MAKNFGIASLAQGLASGKADPQVAQARWQICLQCMEVDSQGTRLPRIEVVPMFGQQLFCGAPRWRGMYRDEFADGCGCPLKTKVHTANTRCPRGRW